MPDILSVGIDIGTSTTQLVFSQITMENTSGYFSVPHVAITRKEVIYKSRVHLTPLLSPVQIDGPAVRRLVAQEYRQAGYTPADVDTGAVIITGESARKENAAAVLENLSDFAGEFVVSTAGPDLESVIAGKGSGACEYSRQTGRPVANLDIGGGTTNIAIFQDGQAVSRGCLDIEGRLIRLAPDWTVTRISPAARLVAQDLGLPLEPGARTGPGELSRLTDRMAGLLGQSLRPEETIRATVVGAGSYTTSVSGSTITYSETALFPLKNLPMLRLTPEEQALCLEGRGEELEEKIRWFLAQQDTDQLILSLPGLPDPEYAPLQRLARALAGAAHRALPPGRPALVGLKQDMAKTLGLLMKKELNGARPVVYLDGVRAEQGDYVDLGRPVLEGLAIPVVVKTLLFG